MNKMDISDKITKMLINLDDLKRWMQEYKHDYLKMESTIGYIMSDSVNHCNRIIDQTKDMIKS